MQSIPSWTIPRADQNQICRIIRTRILNLVCHVSWRAPDARSQAVMIQAMTVRPSCVQKICCCRAAIRTSGKTSSRILTEQRKVKTVLKVEAGSNVWKASAKLIFCQVDFYIMKFNSSSIIHSKILSLNLFVNVSYNWKIWGIYSNVLIPSLCSMIWKFLRIGRK